MGAQRNGIGALVRRGSPSAMFLWPIDLVDRGDSFGYAMALRPPGFVGLGDLMRGRVDVGMTIALRICVGLSNAFLQLHSLGLCYRDVSLGNIMFDPADGRILICDNDNVGLDGTDGVVLGTRRFMAPEVVLGKALPSIQTDLHSLAVMIFYVLMIGHPLLGRQERQFECVDEEAERCLFGDRAQFVFDPDSDANAPDPTVQSSMVTNWSMQPAALQKLFTTAFTTGLNNPGNRVRESAWRKALAAALDSVLTCPKCSAENVATTLTATSCWYCGEPTLVHLILAIGRSKIIIGGGGQVTQHHLNHDYVVTSLVGEFVQHPTRGTWGLRNRGKSPWQAMIPGRPPIEVPPERAVALIAGATIDFGATRGHVQLADH